MIAFMLSVANAQWHPTHDLAEPAHVQAMVKVLQEYYCHSVHAPPEVYVPEGKQIRVPMRHARCALEHIDEGPHADWLREMVRADTLEANWFSGTLHRFEGPRIRPRESAVVRYLDVVNGKVTGERIERHTKFESGFREAAFHGARFQIPADMHECGEGCFERADVRIDFDWDPRAIPLDRWDRYAESAHKVHGYHDQLPDGRHRTLTRMNCGVVVATVSGDHYVAWLVGGLLLMSADDSDDAMECEQAPHDRPSTRRGKRRFPRGRRRGGRTR